MRCLGQGSTRFKTPGRSRRRCTSRDSKFSLSIPIDRNQKGPTHLWANALLRTTRGLTLFSPLTSVTKSKCFQSRKARKRRASKFSTVDLLYSLNLLRNVCILQSFLVWTRVSLSPLVLTFTTIRKPSLASLRACQKRWTLQSLKPRAELTWKIPRKMTNQVPALTMYTSIIHSRLDSPVILPGHWVEISHKKRSSN